jgi:hypothetical protein
VRVRESDRQRGTERESEREREMERERERVESDGLEEITRVTGEGM